ncbi:glycosyltransferase family 2 protein [Haloarcula litorea]|uniref:glycosyltransferase family 2 protein n=1 Tax=Haloarcula litorea TaxID=3032579 RepID=UPI0023E7F49D|nr:glycosyltransferase family 2 protein [Halomicroarcula sp. GDY20]
MSGEIQPSAGVTEAGEMATNLPAVGLVATESNAEWIAAEVLRVHARGHRAIVTAERDADLRGLTFARLLDAEVVDPPADCAAAESARERLRAFARQSGYPGLVYHDGRADPVDLPASCAALESADEFAVDARLASPVEPEPTVLVGIPAYNEASTIGAVVEAAAEHADAVLVVDDGSDDDTVAVAEAAGATVYEHERNVGYGGALKSLFEQARRCGADHLAIVDGDGQHDPGDIPALVDRQRETDADLVIGCRFGETTETEMPRYRRLGLSCVNLLTNVSLGAIRPSTWIRDTQSGFRVYSRAAIESLAAADSLGENMDASTNILYHVRSNGYRIEEVPTTIDYDVEEHSSQSPIEHGLTLVGNIVRTVEREHPILTLGVPGLLCVLVGAVFGYLTVFNYVQSGSFPLGHSIVTVAFLLVGVFSAFTAIILHSLQLFRE